jgi:NADPH-dependent ferric siderophore reductase
MDHTGVPGENHHTGVPGENHRPAASHWQILLMDHTGVPAICEYIYSYVCHLF